MMFPPLTRREMLQRSGMGFGMLGLASLLSAKEDPVSMHPLAPRAPHFRATAQRVVHVGSSRVDLQACKLEYSIVSPK